MSCRAWSNGTDTILVKDGELPFDALGAYLSEIDTSPEEYSCINDVFSEVPLDKVITLGGDEPWGPGTVAEYIEFHLAQAPNGSATRLLWSTEW